MSDLLVTDAPQITINEFNLCKNAAELLHKHYPGHLWAVDVQGAVLNIRDVSVSGEWGYTLHIPKAFSASDWDKQVMRAGGEILERFKLARSALNESMLVLLPKDFSGRHAPEL